MFTLFKHKILTLTLMAAAVAFGAGEARAQSGAQVASAINSYRTANGRSTLATNAGLQQAAQQYAQFLANRDQGSATDWHTLDGKSPQQRAAAAGYTGGVWENVQTNWGYADPVKAAMDWWKNSPGHNANMLNPDHKVMGVGAAKSASGKWFFVAMFGQQTSGGNTNGNTNGTMQKVTVRIENRTNHAVTFSIEDHTYTLQPGATGTYWRQQVGPVHYGYTYQGTNSGGGGAGILQDRTTYAFVQDGTSGHRFTKVGPMP
jgi:uncharacterized protein YkwD